MRPHQPGIRVLCSRAIPVVLNNFFPVEWGSKYSRDIRFGMAPRSRGCRQNRPMCPPWPGMQFGNRGETDVVRAAMPAHHSLYMAITAVVNESGAVSSFGVLAVQRARAPAAPSVGLSFFETLASVAFHGNPSAASRSCASFPRAPMCNHSGDRSPSTLP